MLEAAIVGFGVSVVIVVSVADLAIVALKETVRLMHEIDEVIPSWPIE